MSRPSNHRLPSDPPGVPARRAALRLLDAVLRRGLAIEQALEASTKGLPPSDRGLAHAIAAEVLRWLSDLDALIDSATRNRLPDDAKARFALRIALAQALRLGTPPHAAISTVLPLVDGGPRKLVHGVFGTLDRKGAVLPDHPSLPGPVHARIAGNWGERVADAAAAAIAAPPPLDLTLRAEVAELHGESLVSNHLRITGDTSVPELPGYAEGAWWVQDLAASLPARLLGGGTGRALDLCAAPGGKTLQLAASGWDVTAVDISESRLARLSENLDRTGLSAKVVTADLMNWEPGFEADAVLLDAPCSATGIFRRHPDVLHRVRPRVISEMAELQAQLLPRAARWVRPGGLMVYATCSLEPEEGEHQIERFLAGHPEFAIDPVLPDELPEGLVAHERGWLRTLPDMLVEQGGLDGFFMVRLMRVAGDS
ncbi:methyltransferase domain-containing protein [Sphingomonas koreensis]|jgi:16S rRNA (cytosine967-C5)-methyltransferase|uniref:Methyltransferase domain-containing protein n=1 Tax=Sphingomonas koreensis TaxID=93064 RepID=A0A1L6J715_9SPHN|nr:RsmB/NOP family class I SAM-dependent RNA methyltransferase [Sphingomonas koreensis]APR51688.1 SAM-dependent methyltransferase [Sphingomonas koreensis]MDC7811856.1 RsmB/NOP family class I SAM-dependent RNA methyltransferase [Sphingomonas koreensis]RSU21303.1 methyltransferase domain-containing protein [Sphingomonas koreensis]RSU23705.1 methyltransferase domain-containing protein [Sphingomonas koreensis]RSU32132.1 methyltransferase domain-containing protein [Sphingomonas koreensis]